MNIPEITEKIGPSPLQPKEWERRVWQRYQNACANCGSHERLRVSLVVPLEAGGQQTDSNGVLLCRGCEMAADAVRKGRVVSDQRLVNFWVSRRLFDSIQKSVQVCKGGTHGFRSMGALVRYLIDKFVEDDSRFEDLLLYQDESDPTERVKVNVWVEKKAYNTFKAMLDVRGVTVTSVVRSLIALYEQESEVLIGS